MQNIHKSIETKSRKICSVPQCSSYCTKDISLHAFPTDPKLSQTWKTALKIGNSVTKHMLVCSQHFTTSDFTIDSDKRQRLKKHVIPSKKIPQFSHSILKTAVKQSGRHWLQKCTSSMTNENLEIEDHKSSLKTNKSIVDMGKELVTTLNKVSVPKGEVKSTVVSSNDIIFLSAANIEDVTAETALDKPEIKLKTISAANMTTDPLQVKEDGRDSIDLTKKDQASPKPVFQIYPVALEGIKESPILLRKVPKPPVSLLKKITPQNVIAFQYGNKLIAVQEAPKKNPDILCVVKECPGNATHFFKVPDDWRRISIWSYCLKCDQKLKPGDFICDKHFIKEDIEKIDKKSRIGVLKPFAVPSFQNVLVGCCISQCINQTHNTRTMYPIPIWGNYQSWLQYMDDANSKISQVHDLQQYRVCDRHFFKPSVDLWHKLTPTLYLPTGKKHDLNKLQDNLKTPAVRDQNEFCTFLGCKSTKENSYFKFYKFPTEYDRAIKWIEACDRPDILKKTPLELETYMKDSIGVCFHHKNTVEMKINRLENSMRLNRLKNESSADPTAKVDQGQNEGDKSGGSQESEQMFVDLTDEDANPSDSNQLTGEKCYVPSPDYCAFINCSTFKKDLVKKYRFPADNELLAQWIDASAIPKALSEDTIRTLFVCGKHFNPGQYTERGTLILSSVPAPHTEFVDSSTHEGNEHWIIKQKKTQKMFTGSSSSNEASKSTVTTANKDGCGIVGSDKRPDVSDAMVLAAPRHDKGRVKFQEDECVVKHCKSNRFTKRLYRFPMENRFKCINWIKAVENKSVITAPLYTAYLNKRICDIHFEKRYKNMENWLLDDAVPSLHLVTDSVEDQVIDTSIEWKECNSDICDADVPDSRAPYLKGNAILHKHSIEFPNIKRELRFGKDCQKYGFWKTLPYKVYKMNRKNDNGKLTDSIGPGPKVQIHTAIIVDDDDQSEKDAVTLLSKIISDNAKLAPKRRVTGWGDRNVVPTKKRNT